MMIPFPSVTLSISPCHYLCMLYLTLLLHSSQLHWVLPLLCVYIAWLSLGWICPVIAKTRARVSEMLLHSSIMSRVTMLLLIGPCDRQGSQSYASNSCLTHPVLWPQLLLTHCCWTAHTHKLLIITSNQRIRSCVFYGTLWEQSEQSMTVLAHKLSDLGYLIQ